MQIARRFTTAGRDPYESVAFRSATSEIRNPDGSVVFAADGIEVPAEWSQVACDILAQKYLRKAGVPARLVPVAEEGVPKWLWRRVADTAALAALARDGMRAQIIDARTRRKRSIRGALTELLGHCESIAPSLGCSAELAAASVLAADPGAARQRRLAADHGIPALPETLETQFTVMDTARVAA